MRYTKFALAAIALALFGSQAVMAQQKTRAEVQAECAAARKAGKVVEGECQPDMPAKATSTTDRKVVKEEAKAAARKGETVNGEAKPDTPKKVTSTKTRAQVKAECEAARKAGKIVEGECQP